MFDPAAIRLPLRFAAEVHRGTHADWTGHDYSKARPIPETAARLLWGPNDLGSARIILREGRLVAIPEIAPPDPSSLLFTVTAVLARVRLGDRELLSLHPGSVLPLGQPLYDPLELSVAGTVFAYGETVTIEDRFAVRVMSTKKDEAGAARISGSGSSVLSVILGRADMEGGALSAATEGNVFALDSLVGKPFVGEVNGIPLVTGDIICTGNEALFRIRTVIAGETHPGGTEARSETVGRPADTEPDKSPSIIPFADPSCKAEKETTAELFEPSKGSGTRRRFSAISAPTILRLVRNERPQIIAAVLSCLPPDDSSYILARLPAESVGEVSRRLATIQTVKEDSLRGIERILERKAGSGLFSGPGEPVDGRDLLLSILSRCDRFTANWVRLWIREWNADLSARLFSDSDAPKVSLAADDDADIFAGINEDFRQLKKEERDRVMHQLCEILKRMEEEDSECLE